MKKDILIGVLITIGLLSILEISLRIYAGIKWSPIWDKNEQQVDSYTGARLRPNYKSQKYSFNSLGFRSKEISVEKPVGTIRIAVMGDSVPFGFTVANSYPEELQKILDSSKKSHYEIINAGVPGFSSWNVLRMLEKYVLHLHPDVVVFHVGLNDIWMYNPYNPKSSGKYTEIVNSLTQKIYTLKFVFKIIERVGMVKFNSFDRDKKEQMIKNFYPSYFATNLEKSIKLCKEHNIKVLVLTLSLYSAIKSTQDVAYIRHPYFAFSKEHHSLLLERYNLAIKKIADEQNVGLFDLDGEIRKILNKDDNTKMFVDDAHFNDKGNNIVARLTYKNLIDSKLIK